MDFSGWEKLSLVDFDDNLTTTLFMAGCPFRCPFCHNGDLVIHPENAPKIPWEEIKEYLIKRQGMLDAVCISGGEPTLMPDLKEKIREIKELGYIVKLDSNGWRPDILKSLIEEKLVDHIAMDIKNSKEKYCATAGVEVDMKQILESVDLLMNSGISYEFRTTLIDEFHDEEDIRRIGEWIKGAKMYRLQRFIDSESCIQRGLHQVSLEKAKRFLEILKPYINNLDLRGYDQ